MKIPKDVSPLRRKIAEALARRKIAGALARKKQVTPIKKEPDKKLQRTLSDTAEARKKARVAEQNVAERDLLVKELQEKLDAATKELEEKAPLADKWIKHNHRRRETLIAKFPKEEQARVRKFDAEALEALAEAKGYTGAVTTTGETARTGSRWTSVEELSKLSKTDPETYNKGVDDIASGAIKLDAAGKVVV